MLAIRDAWARLPERSRVQSQCPRDQRANDRGCESGVVLAIRINREHRGCALPERCIESGPKRCPFPRSDRTRWFVRHVRNSRREPSVEPSSTPIIQARAGCAAHP